MVILNPQQKQAAGFFTGICSVIAIPGSGKTLTMTERISRLIRHHNVPPESILGLTFTRNAAQNMRDRLALALDDLAVQVTLATIHSFCFSLLKSEGKVFDLLTGLDQMRFLKKLVQRLDLDDWTPGEVLSEISLAKNNLISVEEFRDLHTGNDDMLQVAQAYERYDQEKTRKMLYDFDDLLVETYRLLNQEPETRQRYQQQYRHILIDEFQDQNPAQIAILKLLISEADDASFWVCADEMQSIFSFSGASIANVLNFAKLFPGARQFILEVNYRSTPQILKACQNLMRHNVRKIHKELTPLQPPGDEITLIEAVSEEDEALHIVNEVMHLTGSGRFVYKDIAVLYRANFQSRVIEEAFAKHKIPYRIENGLNFYQRPEIRNLLSYMLLIENHPSNEAGEALKAVLNVPNRYLGKTFLQQLENYAHANQLGLYQALKTMPIEISFLKTNVVEFIRLVDPLMEKVAELEPADLLYVLREALDYDRFITEDNLASPDDSKLANLNQLMMAAGKFSDVKTFLKYTSTFQEDRGHDEHGVALMTIHKSKGLEFPVVFVIGLVEGILPNRHGDLEEERRIAFVALSRAMAKLYVSYSQTYQERPVEPSIFLEEIFAD